MKTNLYKLPLLLIAVFCLPYAVRAAEKPILVAGQDVVISTGMPDQVTFKRDAAAVLVTCTPGKNDYPGVTLKPKSLLWDLSAYGYVEAKVTNTCKEGITVCLRVDNDGDWTQNPWSSEVAYPKPGETVTVKVRFGYSWGKPGYKLNPAKINEILIFSGKSQNEQSFRVDSVQAGGSPGEKPPVNPQDIRIAPKGGVLLGTGAATEAELRTLVDNISGGAAVSNGAGVTITLPAGNAESAIQLKPPVGRWDLRDYLQVVVRARNTGKQSFTLRARLDSGSGSEWVTAAKPTPAGETAELTLPFAGDVIVLATNGQTRGGSPFESDKASGIIISAIGEGERTLELLSVKASVPPPAVLPAWLGKRPPVEGKWKQTMAEEFSGKEINDKLWTIYHPNYWDKQSHFSKQNDILGEGLLRLRFEKKRGHADDDPAKPETDWATGFLTSTHKWTQLYGYFECRQKLPRAPGMWPAFWMMPDRGEAAGAGREATENGGMEFDILEYLARYGPYRYNIATHWDGYGADHKSTGTDRIYVQPDKDGFFTAGLLWEPGSTSFYCNGKLVCKWQDPRVSSVPMYILFTAVSGGWGGNELTGEGLPSDYVLDYVRAWQKE